MLFRSFMVLLIHQGRGIALFTGKEVLINAQYLGAIPARQFTNTLLYKGLIPALNRGTANLMGVGKLTLTDPALMGFKHL